MSEDINLLNHKFDNLTETVGDIKSTIRELAAVITKFTIVEERQINTVQALESLKKDVADNHREINKRLTALEKDVPANKRVSIWIDRGMWAGAGLLVMLVVKRSGLL